MHICEEMLTTINNQNIVGVELNVQICKEVCTN